MRTLTQTSSNPQSDFIRAGRGDATRWASMYLISRQLDSDSTQSGIPVYVFRLASLTGTLQKELNAIPEERRYQRMYVLSFLDSFHRRMAPTVLPSGSLCLALLSHYALPCPIFPLPRYYLRPPLLRRLHHQRRHLPSLRRRRSSTSTVSRLA